MTTMQDTLNQTKAEFLRSEGAPLTRPRHHSRRPDQLVPVTDGADAHPASRP